MKVTTKGQVTIPREIRRMLGIQARSEVEFVARNGKVELVKLSDPTYRERLDRLRGSWRGGMTTDELMRLTRGDD